MTQHSDEVDRIVDAWVRQRPDLDFSPLEVLSRVDRLSRHLDRARRDAFRRSDLEPWDWDVLSALRRAGEPFERAPGDLARHTMVTTGAITKRIDRLVEAGLASRRQSDVDGRGRVVALTPEGLELIDRAFEHHMRNEARLLAELEPHQAEQLEGILTAWLARHEQG